MDTAPDPVARDCLVSLLFAADSLPHPVDIFALADAHHNFFISHDLRRDDDPANGLELLAAGLTFDCRWPDASLGIVIPEPSGQFGLPGEAVPSDLRALHLMAGAHLSGGNAALPIAQEALVLAARFCALPGLVAAVWHPASTWLGAEYLVSIAANWAEGGIFPAHGLVGLQRIADGAIQSEGLAFFTGQEIRFEAELLGDPAIAERIAARLVDRLIGASRVDAAFEISAPNGGMLQVVPSSNGRVLRVWAG